LSQQSGIFDSTYVVETAEGFPRGDKAVDAAFLARSKKLYFRNGVFPNPSSNFQVLAHQGMTVQVRPGSCFVNGYEAWDDEIEQMLAPVSSQAQSVFVAQRLTLNPAEDAKIEKALIIGNVSTQPTRNSDVYEIFLARIDIPASATAITDDMITDLRMDGTVCGIVSGAVQSVDTTSLSKQYQSWFESVQFHLDGDSAGALENQIVGITDLQYEAVQVAQQSWLPGSGYVTYPYYAEIPLPGADSTMIPDVYFAMAEASGGSLAPVAVSGAGTVRIYSTETLQTFTIPVIRLRKAVG
jgi:hypothetical protein